MARSRGTMDGEDNLSCSVKSQESPSVWKKEIGKKTRRILPQATCIIQDRAIEFRSFRNLRNLPGVTGSRDTQREEEPILTSRDTTRSMSLRGNERENERQPDDCTMDLWRNDGWREKSWKEEGASLCRFDS